MWVVSLSRHHYFKIMNSQLCGPNIQRLNQYQVCERTPQSQRDQRAALELHVSNSPPTCTLSGGVRDQCFAFKNIIESIVIIFSKKWCRRLCLVCNKCWQGQTPGSWATLQRPQPPSSRTEPDLPHCRWSHRTPQEGYLVLIKFKK